MKFSTRNAFYLRASNYRVVPLFLYLDERHVRHTILFQPCQSYTHAQTDWMTDETMQLVIGEMQSRSAERPSLLCTADE